MTDTEKRKLNVPKPRQARHRNALKNYGIHKDCPLIWQSVASEMNTALRLSTYRGTEHS